MNEKKLLPKKNELFFKKTGWQKFISYSFFLFIALVNVNNSFAQSVSINNLGTAPDGSSMLDVSSTSKGILIPRMTKSQRQGIVSPANGLLIYQIINTVDDPANTTDSGFYYNRGTTFNPLWDKVLTDVNVSQYSWTTAGNKNTTPGTHFIGTTDAQDLVLKTNNAEILRFVNASASLQGGNNSSAKAINSIAYGNKDSIFSSAKYSAVFGDSNKDSSSFGSNLIAGSSNMIRSGSTGYSIIGGAGNLVTGPYTTVFGQNDTAAGYSLTIGQKNNISGLYSFTSGYQNNILSAYSIASGYQNKITGSYSFASGNQNNIDGAYALAIGDKNAIPFDSSYAFGSQNTINSNRSFVVGRNNTANGLSSFINGSSNLITGQYSAVFGSNDTAATYSFATGQKNKITGNYSLASGNQNNIAGSYAMAAGDRDTVSGNYSYAFGLQNKITSNKSFTSGYNNKISDTISFALGQSNTLTAPSDVAIGSSNVIKAIQSQVFGTRDTINAGILHMALGDGNKLSSLNNSSPHPRIMTFGNNNKITMTSNPSQNLQIANCFAIGNENVIKYGFYRASSQAVSYQSSNLIGWYNESDTADLSYAFGLGNGFAKSDGASTNNYPFRNFCVGSLNLLTEHMGFAYGYYNYVNNNYTMELGYHLRGDNNNQDNFRSVPYTDPFLVLVGHGNAVPGKKELFSIGTGYWTTPPVITMGDWDYSSAVLKRRTSFTVTNDGWIGLGNGGTGLAPATPLPSSILHVFTPTDVALFSTKPVATAEFSGTDINYSTIFNYQQDGSEDTYIRGGKSTSNVYILDAGSGKVGIGTNNPTQAKVCIIGSGSTQTIPPIGMGYSYLNATTPTGKGMNATSPYSLYTDGRIWCAGEINVTSDVRTKNILGISDSKSDLELVNRLQVIDYKYKDEISKGSKIIKGFKAQQVKQVFPNAVSENTDILPDIYKKAKSISIDNLAKTITISVETEVPVKVGDKVKVIGEGGEVVSNVVAAANNSFTLNNWNMATDWLFVYGKEHNDVLNLDYNKIFSAGISAIQELNKEVKQLKAENENIKTQNSELVQNLMKRIEVLEKK